MQGSTFVEIKQNVGAQHAVGFEYAETKNVTGNHNKLVSNVAQLEDTQNDAGKQPKDPSPGGGKGHDERYDDGPEEKNQHRQRNQNVPRNVQEFLRTGGQ